MDHDDFYTGVNRYKRIQAVKLIFVNVYTVVGESSDVQVVLSHGEGRGQSDSQTPQLNCPSLSGGVEELSKVHKKKGPAT